MKKVNRYAMLFLIGMGMFVSSVQSATVTGKVAYEGDIPKPKPISFGAEKQCADMHKDKPVMAEDMVINSNQTVKWALVYVKEGVKGEFKAPEQSVLIDQNGCVFLPHVTAAMVGQKVAFQNNDAVLHNIRSNSKINTPFNIAQPFQGIVMEQVFDKPEVGIELRCDVHFWMQAYLHIFKHPFFAVTGDDGTFVIKDLPAGDYTLEVWHEKLGAQTQVVTVAEGDSKEVVFTLKKSS